MTNEDIAYLAEKIDKISEHVQMFIDDKAERHITSFRYIPDDGRGKITQIVNRERYLEIGLESVLNDLNNLYSNLIEGVSNA